VRLALLHSFYASDQPSGENEIVAAQAQAFAEAGHEVLLLGRHTDLERTKRRYPVLAAWRTLTDGGANPTHHLRRFDPDVVHVHNTVPNIGTDWLRGWPTPVVHTLHNFRPLCANALLYRDGHGCTLCPDGDPWAAVRHSCYRSSSLASLPIAVRNSRGLAANPLISRADRIIALSGYAAGVMAGYGLPEERLSVVPNGIPALHAGATAGPQAPRFAAVGRLRAEKGFAELLAGWPGGTPLDVFGDGPQLDHLQAVAPRGVTFLGSVARDHLRALLPQYSALVFPSLWPEPAVALVVVEALEAGVPVILAAEGSQTPDLVDAGVGLAVDRTGDRFDRDSIADALSTVGEGGNRLRSHCRDVYARQYDVDRWVAELIAVYDDARRCHEDR